MRLILLLAASLASAAVYADDGSTTEMLATGKAVYSQTCVACHAENGKGAFPGVPSFADTDGPLSKTDAVLQKNISEGFQTPDSMMAMPAKGGNPSLTEADIKAVLAFLRTEFGS